MVTVGACVSEFTVKTFEAEFALPAASVKPSATAPSKPVNWLGAPTFTTMAFPLFAKQSNL
jgi:hypothetical protein